MPSAVTAANLGISRATFPRAAGLRRRLPARRDRGPGVLAPRRRRGPPLHLRPAIRLLHNDNRVTLRQFGERQEQGAVTAVYLASKRPCRAQPADDRGERPDHPRTTRPGWLQEGAEAALSLAPLLELTHLAARMLERIAPRSRALRKAYWTHLRAVHLPRSSAGAERGRVARVTVVIPAFNAERTLGRRSTRSLHRLSRCRSDRRGRRLYRRHSGGRRKLRRTGAMHPHREQRSVGGTQHRHRRHRQ